MIKQILVTILILFCIISNLFALTTNDILKYKGEEIVIVQDNSVSPYTISGILLGIVITKNNRTFVMLQTYNYQHYTNGIAFIRLDNIIHIKYYYE